MSDKPTATYTQEPDPAIGTADIEADDPNSIAPDDEDDRGTGTNAADRRQVRQRARKIKQDADERAMVLRTLLEVDAGKAFIAWLLCDVTGVFVASINADLNPQFSMHREGQRAVGLVLQQECLKASPEQYMVALRRRLTQGMGK